MHLFEFLEKIVGAESNVIELQIPEGGFNLLMLKILQEKAKEGHKNLTLLSSGPRGKRLIETLGEPPSLSGLSSLPHPRLSAFNLRRLVLALVLSLGVLVSLGAAGYWAVYYLPKAEAVLTLSPLPLVKEIAVTVDTAAREVELQTGIIPGVARKVEESGQKSAPATGTALVGDKAKGTIVFDSIINQNCAQGTNAKDDATSLVFLTDISFSIDAIGTKSIAVTAEKIGSDYNLTGGRHFTILSGCTSNGQIEGDSTSDFTGGSSKQVTVVSTEDQEKLLADLKQEVSAKAKTDLTSGGASDEIVVDQAIKSEVLQQSFSHAVGEQTDRFTATLKMQFEAITYRGSDIQTLVSQAIAGLVPSGYALFPGETKIEPLEPKLTDKILSFQAKVTAQVIPKLDLEKIKADLAGRDVSSAQAYFATLKEVTAYELTLRPNLPDVVRRIPKDTGRITITLATKEIK